MTSVTSYPSDQHSAPVCEVHPLSLVPFRVLASCGATCAPRNHHSMLYPFLWMAPTIMPVCDRCGRPRTPIIVDIPHVSPAPWLIEPTRMPNRVLVGRRCPRSCSQARRLLCPLEPTPIFTSHPMPQRLGYRGCGSFSHACELDAGSAFGRSRHQYSTVLQDGTGKGERICQVLPKGPYTMYSIVPRYDRGRVYGRAHTQGADERPPTGHSTAARHDIGVHETGCWTDANQGE